MKFSTIDFYKEIINALEDIDKRLNCLKSDIAELQKKV